MTGRRSNTGAQPTPLEETEPTAPTPEPQPVPEPEPPADPEPEPADGAELSPWMAATVRAIVTDALSDVRRGPFGLVAAQQEDYPLTVHEAIAEVTRRIDAIAKAHSTESGERYKYRGIDDVFAALHPLLGEVGLVILPGRMIEHRRETRATSKGGTLNVAMVRVRYTLVGPDGSKLSGEAWGEAHDSGDKATQKALSQAYKSFTLQLFSIPTESSAEDEPDRTNEPGRPFTTEERARAQTAWGAARQSDTVEKLAGVRQRALHLLEVPLDGASLGEDTSVTAPLSWWIDRRRSELEGAQS